MGVGAGIGQGLANILFIALVSVSLLLIVGLYSIIDYFFIEDKYEVATPIKPQIKLVTDGKTVDTVYVYKFN
jgi:hypothetical protein